MQLSIQTVHKKKHNVYTNYFCCEVEHFNWLASGLCLKWLFEELQFLALVRYLRISAAEAGVRKKASSY